MADHSIYERSIGRGGAAGERTQGDSPPGRPPARRRHAVAALAALAGLAVIAGACSNSPKGPGVAGGPTTTSAGGHSPAGPTGGSSTSDHGAQLLAYAKCMRSHRIADFPDPTQSPGGGASLILNGGPGSDLNANNPTFQAALAACKSLRPSGQQTPAQVAQNVAAGVKLAECMRSHGFPSFPDPNSQDVFNLPSGIDTSSPTYQSAYGTCQKLTPGYHGGSFSKSNGGPR